MTKKYLAELTFKIIGAAIKVHKSLGPGLLESVYHRCLVHELCSQGIHFTSETKVPIFYDDLELETNLRCDVLVEDCIVVELKSVEEIKPIFKAQLITYMKLLNTPKGILLNFNCLNIFMDGQQTFVNDMYRYLPEE